MGRSFDLKQQLKKYELTTNSFQLNQELQQLTRILNQMQASVQALQRIVIDFNQVLVRHEQAMRNISNRLPLDNNTQIVQNSEVFNIFLQGQQDTDEAFLRAYQKVKLIYRPIQVTHCSCVYLQPFGYTFVQFTLSTYHMAKPKKSPLFTQIYNYCTEKVTSFIQLAVLAI